MDGDRTPEQERLLAEARDFISESCARGRKRNEEYVRQYQKIAHDGIVFLITHWNKHFPSHEVAALGQQLLTKLHSGAWEPLDCSVAATPRTLQLLNLANEKFEQVCQAQRRAAESIEAFESLEAKNKETESSSQ